MQEPKFQHTNYGRVTPSDRTNRNLPTVAAGITASPRPVIHARQNSSRPVSPSAPPINRGRLSPTNAAVPQQAAGGVGLGLADRNTRGVSGERLGSPVGSGGDTSINRDITYTYFKNYLDLNFSGRERLDYCNVKQSFITKFSHSLA